MVQHVECGQDVERANLELKGLNKDLSSADRDYLESLDKMVGEAASDAEDVERRLKKGDEDWEEQNKSYEFNFSKRVDLATTQMLNSMIENPRPTRAAVASARLATAPSAAASCRGHAGSVGTPARPQPRSPMRRRWH